METFLLKARRADNRRAADETALYCAAFGGHEEIVEVLIAHGADVNTPDESGRTVVHWTAYGGYPQVLRLLIKKGASVYVEDKLGQTPLDYAVASKSENKASVVELLERHIKDQNR